MDLTVYVDELRVLFAVVVALKFATIAYLYVLSKNSGNTNLVVVVEKGLDGKETKKTMTAAEYDASVVVKGVNSSVMSLCITCGMHYKWGNPTPLLFQGIMTPMGLWDDPIFKLHILKHKAEGKLERPFKAPASPFAELMGGGGASGEKKEEPEALAADEGKKRGKKDKKND